MSRTYRKRQESFESYYRIWLENDQCEHWPWIVWDEVTVKQKKAQYYTKTQKWYSFGLPKEFRNSVNRRRRARDRQELWKELNISDHEGLYDPWNGKTGDAWSYW